MVFVEAMSGEETRTGSLVALCCFVGTDSHRFNRFSAVVVVAVTAAAAVGQLL